MRKTALLVLLWVGFTFAQTDMVTRKQYLHYARASADWTWNHYDSLVSVWKKQFDPEYVFGYNAPPYLLEMAAIYSQLYQIEGRKEYAARAKKVLLTYGDYRSMYPVEARNKKAEYARILPALPNFFTAMRYSRAYDGLRRKGVLTTAEQEKINQLIGESTDYILTSQEWGAMNRAMLRAECLAWALRAVPHHPSAGIWRMNLDALLGDNWGTWEIEDATIYHGVWLYSLLGCAEALQNMPDLFHTPEMYYYSQYFLNLMSPDDMIPDFGDANWRSNWNLYMIFFEAAATAYKNPQLKWAASRMAKKFIDFNKPVSVGLGYQLMDCYLWADDRIVPQAPKQLSQEVMEDVQGKKVVMRNGWQPTSTYLLLNYRDEGDGGLLYRDYLRDTIPVEEEKMTHGHADENSLSLLMSGGSVLLHDAGYRDWMPSGPFGAYRQDYFHNRICVRQEKIFFGQKEGEMRYVLGKVGAVAGQSVLDFLHNAGSYRKVRTQKIDFLAFPEFDYSRTRLTDDLAGYETDRIITYVKNPELFVVFDVVKSRSESFFTAANLWHTRKIVSQGDHWYDTVYDSIQTLKLPENKHLLIYFPQTHYRMEGVEKIKRHFQNELAIHQVTGQHFELGQTIVFTTVLIPHDAAEPVAPWLQRIKMVECQSPEAGVALSITLDDREILIGAKRDLRMDIVRDWRRPKYTYEAGRIGYADLETNADFLYAVRQGTGMDWTAVNLTKITWGDQVLFEQPATNSFLAFDGSPDAPGVCKIRYWQGHAGKK